MMTNEERITIARKTIEKYGVKSQALVCVEEMSELTKELLKHFNRGENREKQILEEMADVLITLDQMLLIFGSSELEAAVDSKLERLKQRVQNQ